MGIVRPAHSELPPLLAVNHVAIPNSTWFSSIATSRPSPPAFSRPSSVSARAGTIAWAWPPDPGSGASLTTADSWWAGSLDSDSPA
jgi:hypothetical protein